MSAIVRRLFNVQSGEGQLTLLLFAEMFLLGIGFNFVETAVFPLFLTEFGAATLPYLYIINAIVVALLSTLYLRLGRRLTFTQGLLVLPAFLAALAFAYWLALTLGGGRPVTFALPVLFQIAVNFGQVGFWTMAARLLTLRQSKRLFGPIGAGMWVSIVLTGSLIPVIVRAIGTVNLLLLAAGGFAAALALLWFIIGRYRAALNVVEEADCPSGQTCASGTCKPKVCTPGADQTCNHFESMSSFAGHCEATGICTCFSGHPKGKDGKCQ